MRQRHQYQNLQHSPYTDDLFGQFSKHLGAIRYRILLETQILIVPENVRELLGHRKMSLLPPFIILYKLCRNTKINWLIKTLILPSNYNNEIKAMKNVPAPKLKN